MVKFLSRIFERARGKRAGDAVRAWKREGGERLRYEFASLAPTSIVLDLGGFEGRWAERIQAKYGCHIHVFEPHPGFASRLTEKFASNPKVHVHPVALASCDGTLWLGVLGDATSAFREAPERVECRAVEATRYLAGLGVVSVDLAKVNIEGGEYDLIPHFVRTGMMARIGTLQVQFHKLDDGSAAMRDEIRISLAATHRETWCYPFVWEEWVAV